jgi:hypothetical protein
MSNEVQTHTRLSARAHRAVVPGVRCAAALARLARAARKLLALGASGASPASALALVVVAATFVVVGGCAFDSSPSGNAGDRRTGVLQRTSSSSASNATLAHHAGAGGHAVDAGDVYTLQRGDAGSMVDGGAAPVDADSSTPASTSDAGDVLQPPLELDAGDASALPVPSGDAGDRADAAAAPKLCTARCVDGTFECPVGGGATVCRSWPPCYCP